MSTAPRLRTKHALRHHPLTLYPHLFHSYRRLLAVSRAQQVYIPMFPLTVPSTNNASPLCMQCSLTHLFQDVFFCWFLYIIRLALIFQCLLATPRLSSLVFKLLSKSRLFCSNQSSSSEFSPTFVLTFPSAIYIRRDEIRKHRG